MAVFTAVAAGIGAAAAIGGACWYFRQLTNSDRAAERDKD